MSGSPTFICLICGDIPLASSFLRLKRPSAASPAGRLLAVKLKTYLIERSLRLLLASEKSFLPVEKETEKRARFS